MTLQLTALAAVAVLLAWATLAGRQSWLLIAVLAYAIAVSWIIQREMDLLFPALAIAIALGVIGVIQALRSDTASPGDTISNNKIEVITNNVAHIS
ncbi:MAG: hypothetical protein H7Y60_00350 [Rhodospirillaceae bacterium]|nr:hypothetical protein [Rhodospirillales bacterium]